jgi:N-acetylglucosamine kinase-like BadF-type ATPase
MTTQENQSAIGNRQSAMFLGVDGGQSHTEAVIADNEGNILGRGFGGQSNHAEQPGGRERLRNAIIESVSEALRQARFSSLDEAVFEAAHCAMTGGAYYKEEVIAELIKAKILRVGHDAPAALFGATGGEAGVVAISGTGSVVYGENDKGESLTLGGWGHLLGDEGSGFWLAMQAIRLGIFGQDRGEEMSALTKSALEFFECETLRALALKIYGEQITRDRLAKFAERVNESAMQGDDTARRLIKNGAHYLADLVFVAIRKLKFENEAKVATVGGMFRSSLMRETFVEWLRNQTPNATVIKPAFNPAIGALLIAYRGAGIVLTEELLSNLEKI